MTNQRRAGILALLIAIAIAGAVEADEGHRVPDYVRYSPTAVPDRIVISWSGDPATSQAVNWRTDTAVTRAIGEIAPAGDGPGFVEAARRVEARTTRLDTDLGPAAVTGVDLVALEDSLSKLAELNERHARVVELRMFGALTIAETADVLDVSHGTVESDWAMAKAWLRTELSGAA